jgi:hypothetical protein
MKYRKKFPEDFYALQIFDGEIIIEVKNSTGTHFYRGKKGDYQRVFRL